MVPPPPQEQQHSQAIPASSISEKNPALRNGHIEEGQKEETTTKTTPQGSIIKGLGLLDRFLAVWILLAMIVGVILGNFVEGLASALGKGKLVGVSIPIALGLLVMMYPILCKVRFETLSKLFQSRALWVQIGFSVVMNWIVAPFLMVCVVSCLELVYYYYTPLG